MMKQFFATAVFLLTSVFLFSCAAERGDTFESYEVLANQGDFFLYGVVALFGLVVLGLVIFAIFRRRK